MTAAARDLAEKAGPLREAIEGDAVVLAVCAGYQLLGHVLRSVRRARGSRASTCWTWLPRPARRASSGTSRWTATSARATVASSPGSRTTAAAPAWAAAPNRSGACSPGAATTARTAPKAPGTGRSTPPTCTGRCCRRTRGWPITCISRALEHRYSDVGPLEPLADQAEAQAHAASLRLARRPARRWRAASVGGSRIRRRQLRAPARAAREDQASEQGDTVDFSLSADQRELTEAAADFARKELNHDLAEARGRGRVPEGCVAGVRQVRHPRPAGPRRTRRHRHRRADDGPGHGGPGLRLPGQRAALLAQRADVERRAAAGRLRHRGAAAQVPAADGVR